MTCTACANPTGGLYLAGCRACSLRHIAKVPEQWKSQQAKKLTPGYVAQLRALGDPAEVHLEVKSTARALAGVAA